MRNGNLRYQENTKFGPFYPLIFITVKCDMQTDRRQVFFVLLIFGELPTRWHWRWSDFQSLLLRRENSLGKSGQNSNNNLLDSVMSSRHTVHRGHWSKKGKIFKSYFTSHTNKTLDPEYLEICEIWNLSD